MGSIPEAHNQSRHWRITSGVFVILAILVILSLLVKIPVNAAFKLNPSFDQSNIYIDSSAALSIPAVDHLLQINSPVIVTDALQVLHSFGGPDGASPNSLIQATSGLFYGTTGNGGDTTSCAPDGCGILFTLDTAGTYTIVHTFHATDGYIPTGLTLGSDGNFYGTTISGGQPSGGGGGTLFRISSNGTLTTLYAFVGGLGCCDGAGPVGHPIQASDGNYYGLTGSGGAFRDFDHQGGFGTFYQFNPNTGVVTILHSFNITDGNGIFPAGSLVQGIDGFFYGVTSEGGVGGGTIFKIDSGGNITLLHAIADSAQPLDGLIQASDGFFYGTTDGGATAGTIFRIDSAGNYNLVNRFDGGDGYRPHFGLYQASDGSIYGTTPQGGLVDFQAGSLFRTNTAGNLSIIHSFTQVDTVTGIIPNSVLIQGMDGKIYGTTGLGGANSRGTIFRFDPALPGPVAAITVTPQIIFTPGSATGTVTLTSPAPQGGIVVNLRAASFDVVLPFSVTVPAGMTNASFSIQASQVIQPQDVRLYASVVGEGIRTVFTLLPPGSTPTPTVFHSPTPTTTQIPPTHTPPPPTSTPTAFHTPTPTSTQIPPTQTPLPPTPTSTGRPKQSPTPTAIGSPTPTPTIFRFPTSTSTQLPPTQTAPPPTPTATGISPFIFTYKIFLPLADK